MESTEKLKTIVLNLMDGREHCFALPPQRAVVAAHEIFDLGVTCLKDALDPPESPCLKEHLLGFSCGDWIAYKDNSVLEIN